MSFNRDAVRLLNEIASMMELLGENPFKINAHARAARAIEGMSQDLSAVTSDRSALTDIEGIGPKIADKLIELAETGGMTEHKALAEKVPAGLMGLLNIPGLGPKTVRLLWQERGVTDLAGLKAIIEDGSILELPRMGKKAVEKISAAIKFAEQDTGRLHLGVAMPVAEAIKTFTGIEIDRGIVMIDEPIREIGLHDVTVQPHPEVEFTVTLDVIPA